MDNGNHFRRKSKKKFFTDRMLKLEVMGVGVCVEYTESRYILGTKNL